MVSIEDLRKMYWLSNLSNRMLEKITPHVELSHYQDRDLIFEEGERAEYFYMLKRGKILLEVELSKDIIISLGSVKTGFSLGWSALLKNSNYTSYARCVEPCEVMFVRGETFVDILDADHDMGYIVMQGVVQILKNRLERRTHQFVQVMQKHPDIIKMIET